MAWVRIDDQAPRHQKMLTAGPAACWLWVCGIAHAQSQLTDGFISIEALPMIGVKGTARVKRLAEQLVEAGLFDRGEGGYYVHGYLDMNPSRAIVLKKRAEDADRKRPNSERNLSGIQSDSDVSRARVPSHPIRTHPIPSEKREPSARSKRPIFTGQRLTVFEWMLDDFTKILGNLTESFDLHAWFFELDARAAREQIVIPQRDSGAWLQSQLIAEAQRRGLPIAVANTTTTPAVGKLTTRMADMVARSRTS